MRRGRLMVKPKRGRPLCVTDYLPGSTLLRIRPNGTQIIETPHGQSLSTAVMILRGFDLWEYVEADSIQKLTATPDDPLYVDGTLWGLHNIGQDGGTVGADIGANDAWNLRSDASDVIVAVIDSGINYEHADLADNLWVNPNEVADGTDTDGNGYVDDLNGINAVSGDANIIDGDGHGTHVAGIIGAVGDNAVGGVGVAWSVQLMILKFTDTEGAGLTSDAITCIDYAIANGAKVINCSWGSTTYSAALRDALLDAANAGILVVAAAGDDSANNDLTPFYPASYQLANVIAVGGTSRRDNLSSTSNYGPASVHLGAPGAEITSTAFTGGYEERSGSSMAAAYVSGAVAIVIAQCPTDNYRAIKDRILEGVDPLSEGPKWFITGGRLNLWGALNLDLPREIAVDAQWPDYLPLPKIEFSGEPRIATLASPVQMAATILRSRQTRTYATVAVEWVMTFQEYLNFRPFFEDVLDNGLATFKIPLRYPKHTELIEWVARFISGYTATNMEGPWQIRASLDLISPSELTAVSEALGWSPFWVQEELVGSSDPGSEGVAEEEFRVQGGGLYYVKTEEQVIQEEQDEEEEGGAPPPPEEFQFAALTDPDPVLTCELPDTFSSQYTWTGMDPILGLAGNPAHDPNLVLTDGQKLWSAIILEAEWLIDGRAFTDKSVKYFWFTRSSGPAGYDAGLKHDSGSTDPEHLASNYSTDGPGWALGFYYC